MNDEAPSSGAINMEATFRLADLYGELARCRPFLEPALDYNGGTHAWGDIEGGVLTGVMQLWPAPEGALVTEILRYPKQRVCNVFLGGGAMDQLKAMVPSVEVWAKAQGCQAVTVLGRPGWVRALAPFGVKPLYLALRKEL